MENTDKRLFLLDALALVFRAYYALLSNPRITSKGRNTNAQFGFTNALVDLINNQRPTHMAVCFDTEAPTERHTDFADYKANRQEAPEDLLSALPDIKAIVKGFNIPCVELDGFEADDVIGTLSKQAAAAGYEVYMVTPDKDYGQLVDERVRIYKPPYQGGIAEIMGPKEVCEKWNIKDVSQVIDILGLMGDAVDNIPGIKGVGEKTAAKLLNEYQTLENVIANAEGIKGALGEKVRAGKEAAIMSKKLATIITTVPVAFHEEDFRLKDWNKEALNEIFSRLEFKTLAKRILGEPSDPGYTAPENVQKDLFGNAVKPAAEKKRPGSSNNGAGTGSDSQTLEKLEEASTRLEAAVERGEEEGGEEPAQESSTPHQSRCLANTPHVYEAVVGEEAIRLLVEKLSAYKEICFDTETTGIDANDVDIVGMSFSVKQGEG
jgi:DNA polymerase I